MPPASTLRVSRWLIYVFCVFTLATGAPAFARVLIIVDKSTQQMSVSVDGVPRYRFAVSTGRAGYSTPNGTYVNEARIATGDDVALKAGDRIRFGTIEVELISI